MVNQENAALKQPVENEKAIIINQIILRNIDRSMKEITDWRNAHIYAERIVWPMRIRLYDIYADAELDGHLSGLMDKRRSAVLNKKLYFKTKAGKKLDVMDDLIKLKAFRDFRKLIFATQFWGVSGAEFIPGESFAYEEIPRKHIKPEYRIISKEQLGFEGFEYDKMPNVMVMGDRHDLGLLLKCCPYAIWKRGGLADWAQFVEIFGQPVRVVKYDAYDIETKKQVTDILEDSGSSLALMIPKQADFEMMDGKTTNANGDLQDKFKTALNDEMSVIVLGNTETTTSSTSSGYAQAKTHGKQQMEITKSDLEYELLYLNSPEFLQIVKTYGFPSEGGEYTHEQEADIAELSQRIIVDMQLAKQVPVSDDYFYETYDIPKPENYEELKAKMEEQQNIQQQDQPPSDKNKKAKKEKKKSEDLAAVGAWDKVMLMLSDFFAPASKD